MMLNWLSEFVNIGAHQPTDKNIWKNRGEKVDYYFFQMSKLILNVSKNFISAYVDPVKLVRILFSDPNSREANMFSPTMPGLIEFTA